MLLTWNGGFPYHEVIIEPERILGTNVFWSYNFATQAPAMMFERSDDGAFRAYAYVGYDGFPCVLPSPAGRGSMGLCGSQGFHFVSEDFFIAGKRYLFNGSWLGTYSGGALIGN